MKQYTTAQLLSLATKWFKKADKLAKKHFDENSEWDNEENAATYDALMKCCQELRDLVSGK